MRSFLLAVGLNIALIVNAVAIQDVCSVLPYTTLTAEQCPPIHSNTGAHQTQLLDPDTFDALFLKDTTLPKIYNERRTEVVEPSKTSRSSAPSDQKTEAGETQPTATSLTKNQDTDTPHSAPPQESKSGKLLSFEEWKRQVVQQEGDDPSKRRKMPPVKKSRSQQRQQIDSIDGAFGDDVGSMFDNSEDTPPQPVPIPNAYSGRRHHVEDQHPGDALDKELVSPPVPDQKSPPTAELARRKPVKKDKESINPLKKLKELYNYASIDCAATVLQANKGAKSPQSILYESKDQYMLNKCSSDKFVIIDLCESILIDKFVLANFEFFSSTFKDFRVYVADRYPPKEWRLLGQWQARNTRDLQIFKVETGLDWYQYIKIEFLSHYGNEYYCPLSLLRVHGNPMMEYWTLYEKPKITGEDDEEDDMLKGISPDPVVDEAEFLWPAFSSVDIDTKISTPSIPTVEDMLIAEREARSVKLDNLAEQVQITPETVENSEYLSRENNANTNPIVEQPEKVETVKSNSLDGDEKIELPNSSSNSPSSSISDSPSTSASLDDTTYSSADETLDHHTELLNTSISTDDTATKASQESGTASENTLQESRFTDRELPTTTAGTTASISPTEPVATQTASNGQMKSPFGYGQGANMESIYKTIMTRILNLEQNATLSQRYLDEQNRMLNEVFETMEEKHGEQLLQLVGQLNSTAILRIDTMKRRYERLFRMTARELEMTKNETAKELQELTSKLHIMADQVVFEKRLSLIQLILLISLFLFTAANKGTLSALSPIVAAQAEERQRRQSLSHASHHPSNPTIEKSEDVPDSPNSPQFSPNLGTSNSIDSPTQPQSSISSLSDAKRELQVTKSSVDHLKIKPRRLSTAELLSRTVEYDPMHQERWDEKGNDSRRRDNKESNADDDQAWKDNVHHPLDHDQPKLEQDEPEYTHGHENTQQRDEKHCLRKLDADSPMMYDSPAALSEAWPSPSPETPQHRDAPQDHLDGDLRLSRTSSFVDRLDLTYIDSPKAPESKERWWNESDRNSVDKASYHEQQIQDNIEHLPSSDHETYLAPDQRLFDQSTGSENSEDESQSVPQVDGP
ncbi:hypothetical protein VKS41_000510 [Umbelopsis sp. WA50703]